MNAKRIGREVALKLFVNGAGQAGDRLVITSKDGKDLGGWGMFPVVDVVAKAIDEARRAETRYRAGGKSVSRRVCCVSDVRTKRNEIG